jgi:acetoin utilization deacetylase AcuC-like enzyme
VLPSGFPARGLRRDRRPTGISGQLGWYAFDASTPIVAGTWDAALAAARCAMSAAALVTEGEPAAFALCRPPGHHAGRSTYGGYCYLNNAALAAQYLLDEGKRRVSIIDVDYHHGNGTQEIFWERDDAARRAGHGISLVSRLCGRARCRPRRGLHAEPAAADGDRLGRIRFGARPRA